MRSPDRQYLAFLGGLAISLIGGAIIGAYWMFVSGIPELYTDAGQAMSRPLQWLIYRDVLGFGASLGALTGMIIYLVICGMAICTRNAWRRLRG